MGVVLSAIKIIFLLGFIVFIHECGHFLLAKYFKVKVNEFAIGFGKKIWQKKKGDTVYALRIVPLGGFVLMEGEEQRSEAEGSYSKIGIPKRAAILLARWSYKHNFCARNIFFVRGIFGRIYFK